MLEKDRKSFISALKVSETIGDDSYLHTWSELVEHVTQPEAVYIQNFGVIEFPPKLERITSLAKKEASVDYCTIDASKVTLIPSAPILNSIHALSCGALEKTLGIDFTDLRPNFRPTFDSLVICSNGQIWRQNLTYQREPGGFATFILQVPLGDPCPSGRVIIRNGCQQVKTDELAKNGEDRHYLALLAGNCSNRLQEYCLQSSGTVMSLIFNLVWNDFLPMSCHFSAYSYLEILLAANMIAKVLSPWKEVRTSKGKESYICVPIIGNPKYSAKTITTQDLTKLDLILWRIVSDIKFLDTNFARIVPISGLDDDDDYFSINELLEDEDDASPEFRFSFGTFSPGSIADDFFSYVVSIWDLVFTPWWRDGLHRLLLGAPVMVIRARNQSPSDIVHLTPNRFDVLVRNLEDLLVLRNNGQWQEKSSLLHTLDDIVESFANCDNENVPKPCLNILLRTVNICTFLKALCQGFAIIESISKLTEFFRTLAPEYCCCCDECATKDDTEDDVYQISAEVYVNEDTEEEIKRSFMRKPCDVIANFLKFACYGKDARKLHLNDKLAVIVSSNISQENCYKYGKFATTLFYEGCIEEARMIFVYILQTMTEHSVPLVMLDEDGLNGTDFIDLISYFHNADLNMDGDIPNKILALAHNVPLFNLRHLIEYLGASSERLNCTSFLKTIGKLINETDIGWFTAEDFLRIIIVFSELKHKDILSNLWEKVCSESTEENSMLRRLLLETLPGFSKRDDALKTIVCASNARQALGSLFDDLRYTPDAITDCFVYTMALLNDTPPLANEERMETILTELLPSVGSHQRLCKITWFIFTSTCDVPKKNSAIRQVFENVLKRIVRGDLDFASLFKTFRMLAWLGDLELLKTRFDELVDDPKRTIVRLILSSLKNKHRLAASELSFNRETFNFMLVKCVENVDHLKYGRASSFAQCYRLFALAERHFIDSSEQNVAPAFSHLIQRLESREAAKVLQIVFAREVNNEEPSLKKFPPCWHVFKELGTKAVEHLHIFELKRLPTRAVVLLMQCFFYIGEEELISKFQHLVCEMCKIEGGNVDRAIIKHRDTFSFALASLPSIVALNELIDFRMQRLNGFLYKEESIELEYYNKEMCRLQHLRKKILRHLTIRK